MGRWKISNYKKLHGEALEQMGAERPDVLVSINKLEAKKLKMLIFFSSYSKLLTFTNYEHMREREGCHSVILMILKYFKFQNVRHELCKI